MTDGLVLDERDAGLGGDSTHVLVPLHLDVSLVPPPTAPAVLDQPVILPSFRAGPVANSQDTVV